jgi:TolA-binding protein
MINKYSIHSKRERIEMSSLQLLRRCAVVLMLWTVSAISVLGDGLPGEYVLTQRWRNMIADRSPLTNPALMTEDNYLSGRLAIAPILGEFLLGELGFTLPIGLYQSVGLSMLGEYDGTIQQGTFEGDRLVVSEEKMTNFNNMIIGSYAIHFWNRLSAGINLKFAGASRFGEQYAPGGIVDLGLTYRLIRHSLFGDHLVGLSTNNLLMFSKDLEAYSRDVKLQFIGNFWEHRIDYGLDIDFKDFLADAEAFRLTDNNGGIIENGWKPELDFNLKVGMWLLRMFKVYVQAGFDKDILDYVGLALGFNIPTINNGRDLEVCVQYNVMTEALNMDATGLTFSAKVDFGKHREEVYARRMARLASLSPNELYNQARRLYSEKKYWDAFFVFSRITVEFPDFFKSDWVNYYRSSCQEELDMRDVAITNYEATIKDYPLSGAVPYSDLGLMRIYYRNGDFAKVANQFVELSKPNVPDSLRYHGAYLIGQTYLQSNDPQKAIQVLSTIPEGHPDYVFAQHAIAVANVRAGSDMTKVVAALENCVGAKAETESQKEIVSRSYLFLGYIFYEENALSKAVVALRMVPTNSYYAEDALLGQGWTALKARQWSDCIGIGSLLTKTTKKPVLKCEGMLIRAYGHLLQKDYSQAEAVLTDAAEMIRPITQPSDDTLNYARMQYESNRMSFNFLAEKVDNISKSGQTSAIAAATDSLHSEQMSYVKQFKEYYQFADEFKRSSFFTRNADAVRDDIEYALARVQKIVGSASVQKVQKKAEEQEQELNSEIERLQKEMEKLQQENQ